MDFFDVDFTLGASPHSFAITMTLITRFSLSLCLAIALIGCASVPISSLLRPAPGAEGDVLVFRESAFAAGGVSLTVGIGSTAFARMENAEKVRIQVPAGEHEIFVQARSAEPTRVRVAVEKGGVVCLRTSASPGTYAKVVVPITLIASGYHFYLDQVPCPAQDELAKYKDVAVTYQ